MATAQTETSSRTSLPLVRLARRLRQGVVLVAIGMAFSVASAKKPPPPPPTPAELAAEARRLEHEMQRHIRRDAWEPAFAIYSDIVALQTVEGLSLGQMLAGAKIHSNRGELLQALRLSQNGVHRMLKDAGGDYQKAESEPEFSAFNDILRSLSGYGTVQFQGFQPGTVLFTSTPPFTSQAKAAVARCKDAMKKYGSYTGMLPVGEYALPGHHFELTEQGVTLVGTRAKSHPGGPVSPRTNSPE